MSSSLDELDQYLANENGSLFTIASRKLSAQPLLTRKSVESAFAYDPDEEVANFIQNLKQSQQLRKQEFERVKQLIVDDADVFQVHMDDVQLEPMDEFGEEGTVKGGDDDGEVLLGDTRSRMFVPGMNSTKESAFRDIQESANRLLGKEEGDLGAALSGVTRVRRLLHSALVSEEDEGIRRKSGTSKEDILRRIDESLELFNNDDGDDDDENYKDYRDYNDEEENISPNDDNSHRGARSRRGWERGPPAVRWSSSPDSSPDGGRHHHNLRGHCRGHHSHDSRYVESQRQNQRHRGRHSRSHCHSGNRPRPEHKSLSPDGPRSGNRVQQAEAPPMRRSSREEYFLSQAMSERLQRDRHSHDDTGYRDPILEGARNDGRVDMDFLLGEQRTYYPASSCESGDSADGREFGESESDTDKGSPSPNKNRGSMPADSPETPFAKLAATAVRGLGSGAASSGAGTAHVHFNDDSEGAAAGRNLFGAEVAPLSALANRTGAADTSSVHALTHDASYALTPTTQGGDAFRKSDPEFGWL